MQLLHWAVRRGAATSDETLLALLEAGYDPDAHNLGCPCCCFSTTARSMAEGTHAALLDQVSPQTAGGVWQKITWQDDHGVQVPYTMIDGQNMPVAAVAQPRSSHFNVGDPVSGSPTFGSFCNQPPGQMGEGRKDYQYLHWPELVRSVNESDVARLKKIVAHEEFDLNFRPNPGCCGASNICANDGDQCAWFYPFAFCCLPICSCWACAIVGSVLCGGWRPGDNVSVPP